MESNKTIVWSKMQCPYCDMAKSLLKSKEIAFEERMIGVNWTREQLLEQIPQARTVPQIILRGELIGGYDQLKAYFNKGKNE
jgi:glutaredoxin 3